MPEIGTLAPVELDRFRMELHKAGFEIERDGATWTGPLPEALHDLTEAREFVIRLHPGWPFHRPSVWVKGLQPSMHLQGDYLCLWDPTNSSYDWLTLRGIIRRLEEWAEVYRTHPTERDPLMDPHLYWFPAHRDHVLTVDTSTILFGAGGGSGWRKAEVSHDAIRVGSEGDLKVRWYARDEMVTPPSDLAMFRDALNVEQARNLDAELEKVGKGGPDILMLFWRSPVGAPNILALLLEQSGDEITARSVQVGTTDVEVARLRAGRDADAMVSKQVVVFGLGAIGSHVATLLARSGVREMTLVDGERLRPGDLTRHAVTASVFAGEVKSRAVRGSLFLWRQDAAEAVKTVEEHVSDPDRVRAIATGADLVIDAVGEVLFTEQVSRVLAGSGIPCCRWRSTVAAGSAGLDLCPSAASRSTNATTHLIRRCLLKRSPSPSSGRRDALRRSTTRRRSRSFRRPHRPRASSWSSSPVARQPRST